jgi:hypothetical protein
LRESLDLGSVLVGYTETMLLVNVTSPLHSLTMKKAIRWGKLVLGRDKFESYLRRSAEQNRKEDP